MWGQVEMTLRRISWSSAGKSIVRVHKEGSHKAGERSTIEVLQGSSPGAVIVMRDKPSLVIRETHRAGPETHLRCGRCVPTRGHSGWLAWQVSNIKTEILPCVIKKGIRKWWGRFVLRKRRSCSTTPSRRSGTSGLERRRSRSTIFGANPRQRRKESGGNCSWMMIRRSSNLLPTAGFFVARSQNVLRSTEETIRKPTYGSTIRRIYEPSPIAKHTCTTSL